MYPILDRYGSFFLFSYTAVLGVGLLLGFGLTGWLARRGGWAEAVEDWQNGVLWGLFVGLLAGRAGFVGRQWEYFGENGDEVWQLWRGGLDYHAALGAGLVAFWLWCVLRQAQQPVLRQAQQPALRQAQRASLRQAQQPARQTLFMRYSALVAPAFVLVSLFGWAACWLEGCGFGATGTLGWLTADLPNPLGVFALRYRTQLFAFLLTLPLLATAVFLTTRQPHLAFGSTLAGVSLVRLLITSLLGSGAPLWLGWRYELWLEAGFVLLGLLLVQWGRRQGNNEFFNRLDEEALSHGFSQMNTDL